MVLEKRGLYKKIIDIVLDILIVVFAIILAISIYSNIQVKVLGNAYSSFFGYSVFEVQTGSMADTINVGDWIVVKKSKNIRLDDIITYEKNGQFITHRVIEAYKGTYITKGDANNGKDEAVNESQIVGKVVKILPELGIIRKTIFNPVVLIALIATLYLIGSCLKDEKKNTIKKQLDTLRTKLVDKTKKMVPKKEEKVEKVEKEKIEESVVEEVSEKEEEKEGKEEVVETPTEEEKEIIEETVEEAEESPVEVEEEAEEREPDLNQTMIFRMVDVDKLDLDSDNLELAKQEYEMFDEEVEEEETTSKENPSAAQEKLKIVQNRKKKFKNLMDKVMNTKSCEIREMVDILRGGEKFKTNEASIVEELLTDYIDGKYYNFCNNVNLEYNSKNMLTRLDTELKEKGNALIQKYKGNDSKYAEKVEKCVSIFQLVSVLEKQFLQDSDVQTKRDGYSTRIQKCFKKDDLTALELKNMIHKLISLQNTYYSVYKHLLNEQESNTFQLELHKISNCKNFFYASLNHNLSFSKVYSNYIVDKTYSEGVIAEDKVLILLNLLMVEFIKDMFQGEFQKKYFFYLPSSIYSKPNKLSKVFHFFEDEFVKNHVFVVIPYSDFLLHKKIVKDYKKLGYHFALVMEYHVPIKDKDQKSISVADYVFIDKKIQKDKEYLEKIPIDLKEFILVEDILSKINGDGGK